MWELLYIIIGKDIQYSLISYNKCSSLQVEQIPLPLLFMRTVLQAIGAFPTLVRSSLVQGNVIMNKNLFDYCCATEFRNVISNYCLVYRSVLHAHIDPSKLLFLSLTIELFPYFPKNLLSFLAIFFFLLDIKFDIFAKNFDLVKFLQVDFIMGILARLVKKQVII